MRIGALGWAVSCVAGLWACAGPGWGQKVMAPDLILSHGHIFTGDATMPWVEAVAITGDKIVSVGTSAAVATTADKHTRVIDLQGKMAMPGINDAHDHVGGAHIGVEAKLPPPHGPGPEPSIAELAEAVKAATAGAPVGAWIHAVVGSAVIRNPKEAKAALDEAGGEHPVMVESWWGHGVILNTKGMAKVGLTDAAKDPMGGHYDRDADGHLTGLLEEGAGNEIRRRLSDEVGVAPAVTLFKAYAQRRLQQGVTSVQVMATNQRLSYLEKTFVQADEPLRVRIMRFPMPAEDARVGETLKTGEEVLSPMVRVAGVKWVLDGTPIEELAFQNKEYADRAGWRGRPDYPVQFIDAQLKLALTGKDQLMMHIVGDAMTDEVLTEMEKLAPAATWQPLRVRFEHGDGLKSPEEMARAKKLGIVVAQPRPGRPWKAWEGVGIPMAYGSDAGMAPWLMFSVMTDGRNPMAISREHALSVLTSGPAFAEFKEKEKGTLMVGMLADVAVLSQDVMTAAPETLAGTRSVLTVVGGKVAYEAAKTD